MNDHPFLAAAQFHSPARQVQQNTRTALDLMTKARGRGAVLVVLPEYCISGYDRDWIKSGAPGGGIDASGSIVAVLAQRSADLGMAVVFNDLERWQDGLFSASFVLSGGSIVGVHRKTILTEGESQAGIKVGDAPATPVSLPGIPVPVAPMICFEHGFPEIALDLALAGAGVIAISSAIQVGNQYLRNLRSRARAQDNGCYVVAANAVGEGYCGESMIVDPRGDVVVRASATDPDLIVAELDPQLIAEQRRMEPVLQLRRPELSRHPLDPNTR